MPFLSKGLDLDDCLRNEVVLFYLQQAYLLDDHDGNQRSIGEKAYQVLVSLLSKHWERLLSDDQLIEEVIDFFAEEYCWSLRVQPYRRETEDIIKGIWGLVRLGRYNKFAPVGSSSMEEVKVSRYQIARALVRAELFDFILEQQITEAIPALQARLSQLIRVKLEREGRCLPPSIDRIKAGLDNPREWILRVALNGFQTRKAARTLLELIIHRDVPLPESS